ncbi:hypothetical protein T440DRAFT_482248 [Plenodomus tracheiphilus IPT5]|uniref:Carbohydrate-binding module family 18 protein n=1 Tax=Plenodomus tracheiphilus IPT5 TaxID=1408161 RepID=A0A6A7AXC1_9PLEO|nr:hypothetical protein T440DRAFT_482248 [Plenodomus tracheiphilus IPT5]
MRFNTAITAVALAIGTANAACMLGGGVDPNCCWGGKDNVDACNRQGACTVGADKYNYCSYFGITPQDCSLRECSLPIAAIPVRRKASLVLRERTFVTSRLVARFSRPRGRCFGTELQSNNGVVVKSSFHRHSIQRERQQKGWCGAWHAWMVAGIGGDE